MHAVLHYTVQYKLTPELTPKSEQGCCYYGTSRKK
jgi:hypothetical protein